VDADPVTADSGWAGEHAAHGSVGEEATKLVEALAEWARGAAGGDLPIATGSEECTLCPVCQALALMRRAKPETFAHLADAATSLVAAARTVVDTHMHGAGAGRGGVERIDLDEDVL
jgi:hypothetical protein